MNWLSGLLQGSDGSPSTMRVGTLVVICAIAFEHVWATAHGQPQQWDWQQVLAVVGSLGAKAAQVKFETKPETPAPVPENKG